MNVGRVPRGHGQGDRSALSIGQGMDLAGRTPAREADRFQPGPPFVVCAERWAFPCVLSSERSSGTGPATAMRSNRRCQMPREDHRVKTTA